jgi:hypothetical protein
MLSESPSADEPSSPVPVHPDHDNSACPKTEGRETGSQCLHSKSERTQASPDRRRTSSSPSQATKRPPTLDTVWVDQSVDRRSNLDQLLAQLAATLPAISLEFDTLLSPKEVTELLPLRRRGRKAHTSTIFRWMKNGYRGIRLPFIQVGHQRCTSINALHSFLAALTAITRFEQGDSAPPISAGSPEIQLTRPTRSADRHLRIEEELQRRYGI